MAGKTDVVKLEEKILEFEFRIKQAQFNKTGTYSLKLSIQNSHREDLLPQILLDVNNSGNNIKAFSVKTDSVYWDGSQQFVNFNKNHFKFRLPKGFCKNDKNYDVFLMIEASMMPTKAKKAAHIGEARVAIYPRTESPKANLQVKKGREYYHYATVLTLLRPMSKATLSMHCGRLSYSVAFREFIEYLTLLDSDASDTESVVEKKPFAASPILPLPPVKSTTVSTPPIVSSTITTPPEAAAAPAPAISLKYPVSEDQTKKSLLSATKRKPDSENSPAEPKRNEINEDKVPTDRPVLAGSAALKKIDHDIEEVCKSYLGETQDNFETIQSPIESRESAARSVIATPPSLMSERTFHLSFPSTPLLNEPPTYREKTMDQPTARDAPPEAGIEKVPTFSRPRSHSFSNTEFHVAQPGFQVVFAMVHGATSLPSSSDGSDPVPFVTMKSLYYEEGNRAAPSATRASLRPTHSPRWEEVLYLKIEEERADSEEIIITVADSLSKEKLVTFRFLLTYLVPFHPYHFEFIQPTSAIPAGVRLFITMIRRLSHLPRLKDFGFCALEVTLRDFQHELSESHGPLIAALRVVPDYSVYRADMLSRKPLPAGVASTPITFPSPNPSSFAVVKKSRQGHPQLTLPSKQESRPEWNQSFLFSSTDAATMFTPNSALVVELYPSATLMSSVTWNIRNPVAFCTVLLNDELFNALTSDDGKMGIRMDDQLLQGSQFVTRTGVFPSIRLTMRLITTERPDALVAAADADQLPPFDIVPSKRLQASTLSTPDDEEEKEQDDDIILRNDTPEGGPPLERKRTNLLVKEDEFPSTDALRNILPDYVMTDSDAALGLTKGTRKDGSMKRPSNLKPKKEEHHAKSLLDHQAQELEKYRDAVKRMSADIVSLRRSLSQLQEENALLRRELLVNKEISQEVMDDLHRGVFSSAEVADKFVAVKQKLTKETEDLKKYKTKVQNLQNQMIKSNEREKGYLKDTADKKELEKAVVSLQDKLKKEKKLEETCIQQEKVIQKMERLLSKYMKNSTNKQHIRKETEKPEDQQNAVTMLTEENAKLLMEVNRLKAQQERLEVEKIQMAERLRRSEHRTSSLEAQLDHNARDWAKERHELTVRLQEHRNGIVRTTNVGGASDPLF